MTSTPPYLDAFHAPTEEEWRARVASVLKGKGAETLTGRSYDGIAVAPLYAPAAASPPIRRQNQGWAVIQRMDGPDPANANSQALQDLGNGADGLQIVCAGALGAFGFGLVANVANLDGALDGVVFDAEVPIEVDSLDTSGETAAAIAGCVTQSRADPANTRIAFGIDPFGTLAQGAADDFASLARKLAQRGQELGAAGFAGPFFVADARLVHAAGGSEGQELGYALSAALAVLRMLDDAGVPLEQARCFVSFRMAIDADEFLGVAKLRALRRLWSSIEADCGLPSSPAHVHAETAWRMMTRRDPDVNMLRATLAVFAAAIGGADRITVLPHTQALGLPDDFARRVARNTQLVLREEANLDKVADPVAGSGGFEALTDELCERGWDEFRRIEAAGGLAAALADSAFRSRVSDVAEARRRAVAKRRDGITGVSEFPALGENTPHVEHPVPLRGDAKPFAPRRLAEPFEALRDRSDDRLRETGARSRIYLATLGPTAAFTPRAMFAKNLFEAGGFETVLHEGDDTPDALAAGLKASGARIACLCSSDAVYAERAPVTAKALAPHARLVLAGRPGESETALHAAGVSEFAYVGADVLALLERLARD